MFNATVYSIKDITEEYQRFYDAMFNGGSMNSSKMSLYRLKTYLREYYVSRGRDPSDILDQIDDMIAITSMGISKEGKQEMMQEELIELNRMLRNMDSENPLETTKERIAEFSQLWREFTENPTAENANAIERNLRMLQDMKGDIKRYAEENGGENLYTKYVELTKAAGRVQGSLHTVERNTNPSSKVQDNVENFFEKANEFTSYVEGLVIEREEEEEEEKRESVPPEVLDAVEGGNLPDEIKEAFMRGDARVID